MTAWQFDPPTAPLPAKRKDRDRELARRRRLRVTAMLWTGMSLPQVAAAENVSVRRMVALLEKWGITAPRRRGCRPLAVVFLVGGRAALLDRLATERGITAAECAGRILSAALAGDLRHAKRLLAEAPK